MRDPETLAGDLESWHPVSRRLAFLARPRTRHAMMWVFLAGLVAASLAGFLVDAKKYTPWPFFAWWSVLGLLSYTTVALLSWGVFRLLARSADYYGPDEWTGGYEADITLAPAFSPEETDVVNTRPPLTTRPGDDPYTHIANNTFDGGDA